jgi:REP element-mobilizing transposase RayT
MALPLAYFISWTCHGTWLHGDERGSVDRQHNHLGTPILAPDPMRYDQELDALQSPIRTMSQEAREIVTQAIIDHCRIRDWKLHALNVRTNHVHVVVTANGIPPETVMEQFKAWATRRLRRAGLVGPEDKVWTEHGSTRWINDLDSFGKATHYVLNEQ